MLLRCPINQRLVHLCLMCCLCEHSMLAHLLGAPITCTACHKMSHLCCVVFVSIVSSVLLMSHLLVVLIRHCDMMGMLLLSCGAACMCACVCYL